ncbi:type II toxin-antitoxin system RelE/ParE family toxin [Cypionkella sp.]|uniref:type II toxin-antitoxin system RelE/ParE family toxin n=1 Tax=Cypionkella sp. TaxID=2811411 RepID=UPI00260419E6|nr:type II toxin-antitoxin system RelE/ParE family toxin [Cypionkella sp.]MDB5665613.1 type toxin-antitoxin system RelE/ParE family toxin [Cypionkella sp.]
MSRSLILRPLAQADLRLIWDHTESNWGKAKAEDYLQGLGRLFTLLTDHPEIARERRDFRTPVRLHPYHSHLVIFTSIALTLEVIRVIHSRSNWAELILD